MKTTTKGTSRGMANILSSYNVVDTSLFKSTNNNDTKNEPLSKAYLARQLESNEWRDRTSDTGFISKVYTSLARPEGAIS